MLTKSDFMQAFTDVMDKYPTLAAYAKVQDPRLMQNIEAMATMLAMLSAQA